jgi:hypothetical protein
MLVNHTILKSVKKPLDTALIVLSHLSRFNIKATPTKRSATNDIDSMLIGEHNALAGGRANFDASKVQSLIKRAMQLPVFPKAVKYKKTAKGHILFLENKKTESDGNHNE